MSVERGRLLYQQSRYDLAETELRQALGREPGDTYAHALLALTLMQRNELAKATREAEESIHLAPDYPFAHYVLAKVWCERDEYDKARPAIEEAIRLDPNEADYRFLLSAMHYDEKRWQDALREADEGLALDAEHDGCANLRAMALRELGRASEAGAAIDAALARDPENPATHANHGWAWLERGKPDEALAHFKESLRLDPQHEWARQGIVEALKARNPLYAVVLRYVLWMTRLTARARWGILIGASVASSLLGLTGLWVLFGLLTWTAEPFFNLVLRLNRFGRVTLSREQIAESNWVGAAMLMTVLSVGAFLVSRREQAMVAAIVCVVLIIPVAATFHTKRGWRRTVVAVYTGIVALLGLIFVLRFSGNFDNDPNLGLFVAFFFGALLAGPLGDQLVARPLTR